MTSIKDQIHFDWTYDDIPPISRLSAGVRWMTSFGSILAVPGSAGAVDAVAARAMSLARTDRAALTFVDVIAGGEDAADEVGRRRARLEALAEAARRGGIDATEAVLHGAAAVEVIRMVLREGHDLVVAGPGPGTEGLVRDCPCPVLVVKPEGFATPVTLDGAEAETG